MADFIDPRANPSPVANAPPARVIAQPEALDELHLLCRHGRLYDVERWIRKGHALQIEGGTSLRGKRRTSALEIGLKDGNQALVLLLLCNGYDSNLEENSPLDLVLRSRRRDLLDLLIDWGADPHRVDLDELFSTYDSALWQRFLELGVDLTRDRAIAAALGYHTSNKPLFGFARRHREADPRIQRQLDMALAHHAAEGNEKGVALCLWAGADSHASVPSLRYSYTYGDDEEDEDEGTSAIYEACQEGHVSILERLKPDPSRDDFDDLYRVAPSPKVVDVLARHSPPRSTGDLIRHHIWWLTFGFSDRESLPTLERLFELGVRWQHGSPQEIGDIRRAIIKLRDWTFVELLKLLARNDHCSPDVLQELGRTPSFRARMKGVGFIPPSNTYTHRYGGRPSRSREVLSKFGVELPKPKRRLPRTFEIGRWRHDGREIRMDRRALYERVWSEPVVKLAEAWGLSGPGLAKACRQLRVPLPPRGYWAKTRAGRQEARPRLPTLPAGEVEVVVIWAPAPSEATGEEA